MNEHIDTVQSLARTLNKISNVDVPELNITDNMLIEESNGSNWYEVQLDDNWWEAWCEIYDIVETEMGNANIGESNMQPEVEDRRRYDEMWAKTDWTSLRVRVYGDGDVHMLAEYTRADGRSDVMFHNHLSFETPDAIELGRMVASTELGVLMSETQSCADTLDYWKTEMTPHPISQRKWRTIREVSHPTVNDCVQSASDALESNE
jgi:hypothetical protein